MSTTEKQRNLARSATATKRMPHLALCQWGPVWKLRTLASGSSSSPFRPCTGGSRFVDYSALADFSLQTGSRRHRAEWGAVSQRAAQMLTASNTEKDRSIVFISVFLCFSVVFLQSAK